MIHRRGPWRPPVRAFADLALSLRGPSHCSSLSKILGSNMTVKEVPSGPSLCSQVLGSHMTVKEVPKGVHRPAFTPLQRKEFSQGNHYMTTHPAFSPVHRKLFMNRITTCLPKNMLAFPTHQYHRHYSSISLDDDDFVKYVPHGFRCRTLPSHMCRGEHNGKKAVFVKVASKEAADYWLKISNKVGSRYILPVNEILTLPNGQYLVVTEYFSYTLDYWAKEELNNLYITDVDDYRLLSPKWQMFFRNVFESLAHLFDRLCGGCHGNLGRETICFSDCHIKFACPVLGGKNDLQYVKDLIGEIFGDTHKELNWLVVDAQWSRSGLLDCFYNPVFRSARWRMWFLGWVYLKKFDSGFVDLGKGSQKVEGQGKGSQKVEGQGRGSKKGKFQSKGSKDGKGSQGQLGQGSQTDGQKERRKNVENMKSFWRKHNFMVPEFITYFENLKAGGTNVRIVELMNWKSGKYVNGDIFHYFEAGRILYMHYGHAVSEVGIDRELFRAYADFMAIFYKYVLTNMKDLKIGEFEEFVFKECLSAYEREHLRRELFI